MKSKLFLLFGGLLLCGTFATAVDLSRDPYVKLYTQRVELGKVAVKRQQARITLASRSLERARRLIASRAISAEEYDQHVAAYETASAELEFKQLAVKELEAVLEVVKFLREQGKEVPLFAGDVSRD